MKIATQSGESPAAGAPVPRCRDTEISASHCALTLVPFQSTSCHLHSHLKALLLLSSLMLGSLIPLLLSSAVYSGAYGPLAVDGQVKAHHGGSYIAFQRGWQVKPEIIQTCSKTLPLPRCLCCVGGVELNGSGARRAG